MIPAIIRASIANRIIILALAVMMGIAGIWAIRSTPVDAIPDLSDVQVIVPAMCADSRSLATAMSM
jgi:Cu(I)/Ag(I) efflux system membrane protein CusA/SilA